MNWRRGVLLAGIHLAVAGSLLVWQDVRDWPYLRANLTHPQKAGLRLTAWQENEQTVTFSPDPCDVWHSIPPQTMIVAMVEFPVATLSGWPEDCPASWMLAGILRPGPGWRTRSDEVRVSAGLGVLIAIQWILMGGFPLTCPERWWQEPGAFITICTVIAGVLVVIPVVGVLSKLPAMLAFITWFWWFGLVVWKTLRIGWCLARRMTLGR